VLLDSQIIAKSLKKVMIGEFESKLFVGNAPTTIVLSGLFSNADLEIIDTHFFI